MICVRCNHPVTLVGRRFVTVIDALMLCSPDPHNPAYYQHHHIDLSPAAVRAMLEVE